MLTFPPPPGPSPKAPRTLVETAAPLQAPSPPGVNLLPVLLPGWTPAAPPPPPGLALRVPPPQKIKPVPTVVPMYPPGLEHMVPALSGKKAPPPTIPQSPPVPQDSASDLIRAGHGSLVMEAPPPNALTTPGPNLLPLLLPGWNPEPTESACPPGLQSTSDSPCYRARRDALKATLAIPWEALAAADDEGSSLGLSCEDLCHVPWPVSQ